MRPTDHDDDRGQSPALGFVAAVLLAAILAWAFASVAFLWVTQ
jgi:hypothetical protein